MLKTRIKEQCKKFVNSYFDTFFASVFAVSAVGMRETSFKKSIFYLNKTSPFAILKRIMSDSNQIDIDYVSKLARIELTAAEREKFSKQLGQILDYFEKLSKVDVSGVKPSAHAHAINNVWREDVPTPAMSVEDALMNAPKKKDNQIVVPKVVDDA